MSNLGSPLGKVIFHLPLVHSEHFYAVPALFLWFLLSACPSPRSQPQLLQGSFSGLAVTLAEDKPAHFVLIVHGFNTWLPACHLLAVFVALWPFLFLSSPCSLVLPLINTFFVKYSSTYKFQLQIFSFVF